MLNKVHKWWMKILVAGFALLWIANFYISRSINTISVGLDSHKKVVVAPKASEVKSIKAAKPQKVRPWKKTDPKELAKYGITVTHKVTGPSTVEGWEGYLEDNFKKFKVLDSPQAQESLKTMEITPEEYTQRTAEMDKHIAIVQERLKEDPFNEKYRDQLQNIYKARAVGKVLENKVITESPALNP